MTSAEFAEFALEKPEWHYFRSTFGQYGEGYVRLCYANSQKILKMAGKITKSLERKMIFRIKKAEIFAF